jgi:predicted TIM-barrel fold metal-dependent hydrolase
MIYGGVFDRFPKLKIVLGHMGEGLPGQIWRIDNTSDVGRHRRDDPSAPGMVPSDYLRRNFYITTSGVLHGPILKYTIDLFGIDRIMWAIDYPFERSKLATVFMNTVDVGDEDRAKLFHLNAERIFRLAAA